MPPKIVIAGSLNMDFIVQVERLPAPGETALGSNFQTVPGGKGANQAYATGRLGNRSIAAYMAGRVGDDVFGDQMRQSLRSAGVDTSAVFTTEAVPTGVALIWIDAVGQNSIVVASGANFSFVEADIARLTGAFSGASLALFQLESPLPTVASGLCLAKELGVRTILDPAPARSLSSELLRTVDFLTPNEAEACALLNREPRRIEPADAPVLAKAILTMGCASVILKLGAKGCFYSDGRSEIHAPGFPVAAVDTTAAGDVFNGALAVALAEHASIPEALRFANAAAALSTTKVGAQLSVPMRSEVDAFLKSCAS